MKTHALTVEKLLSRLKFSENKSISKVKVTGLKMLVQGLVTRNTQYVKYQALALTVQKLASDRIAEGKNYRMTYTGQIEYAPDLQSQGGRGYKNIHGETYLNSESCKG